MDRERFAKSQATEIERVFSLTAGEEEARARFERLAFDTFEFLATIKTYVQPFSPWPESAGNFLTGYVERDPARRYPGAIIPASLVPRWEAWNREYYELRSRNPRLELRDMMQDISESDTASSWPDGYERHIQDWVDAGDPSTRPPFDDRYGIVTPEFFNRLRELRQRCGGWLYWSDEARRVVFAPEPEWQQVRAAKDEAAAKWRRECEERKKRSERFAERLPEVLAFARRDAAFWNQLRDWELAREAQRPPEPPPKAQSQRSRVTFRMMSSGAVSPEEQAKADNPPIDQIFADFIARVREPDDVLTVCDIVLNLRREMRLELGLDNLIGWAGGPGLGQLHKA